MFGLVYTIFNQTYLAGMFQYSTFESVVNCQQPRTDFPVVRNGECARVGLIFIMAAETVAGFKVKTFVLTLTVP